MGKKKRLKNSGSEAEAPAVNTSDNTSDNIADNKSGGKTGRGWGYLSLLAAILLLALGIWFFYNTLGSRLLFISVFWGRLSRYYWILWLAGLVLGIAGSIILKCNPRKKKEKRLTDEKKDEGQAEKQPEKQPDKKSESESGKQPEKQEESRSERKQTVKQLEEQEESQPEKQEESQSEKQLEKQEESQTEKQPEKQSESQPEEQPEKQDKPEENKISRGPGAQNCCPNCHKICKKESRFCPYCGHKLEAHN